ncbi:biotin--protein ligase [Rhodanobacter sp. B05]|jgi:lipoate-protein ligase A|nr:biotin--protein ligase [Rhodanobacter sp. B05]
MHGEYKMPGGKLIVIDLDVHGDRLAGVQLSGDFFLEPDDALNTINRTLTGQPAAADQADIAAALHAALGPEVTMYGISPDAIAVAVQRALRGEPAA